MATNHKWIKKENADGVSMATYELGYREIYTEYMKIFHELLRGEVTPAIESQLSFAARQVGCGIHAFTRACPTYTTESLIDFVEDFVSMQLKELVVLLVSDSIPDG
jgi:hypothetical protein